MNIRAECLPCYIPENSLDLIYLNFSTPLPKLGYATQRLTHRNFLEVYKKLLKNGGRIIQKTDDRDFFDFSLEIFRESKLPTIPLQKSFPRKKRSLKWTNGSNCGAIRRKFFLNLREVSDIIKIHDSSSDQNRRNN